MLKWHKNLSISDLIFSSFTGLATEKEGMPTVLIDFEDQANKATRVKDPSKKRRYKLMDYKDFVQFANKCGTTFIATIDGNRPRVRPLALQFADESGFYFQTEPVKSFYKQILANKYVELCFYSTEGGGLGKVMRISGEIEFVDNLELKGKLLEERPFLKSLGIQKPEDPLFVLFRVKKGEAFFWKMEDNMKESGIEKLKFECQ